MIIHPSSHDEGTFAPASYKPRMISGMELAGPRVAMIFALR
jgi:hypothetical protein